MAGILDSHQGDMTRSRVEFCTRVKFEKTKVELDFQVDHIILGTREKVTEM